MSEQILDSSEELEPVPNRRPLSTPWIRSQLIVELAAGEIPQTELAKKYGVVRSAITSFKKKYQQEINARRDSFEDEYADMWIASKRARLTTLQDTVEGLVDMELTTDTARTLSALLKAAAEELDQLTNKNNINIQLATYELANVAIDDI